MSMRKLIDQLAAAKAKTIVYTTFFFEPQTDRGLVYIRKIKETLGPGRRPGRVASNWARSSPRRNRRWTPTASWPPAWPRPATCCCLRSSTRRAAGQGRQAAAGLRRQERMDENTGFSCRRARPVPDRAIGKAAAASAT
jgi:hypothetical protein